MIKYLLIVKLCRSSFYTLSRTFLLAMSIDTYPSIDAEIAEQRQWSKRGSIYNMKARCRLTTAAAERTDGSTFIPNATRDGNGAGENDD